MGQFRPTRTFFVNTLLFERLFSPRMRDICRAAGYYALVLDPDPLSELIVSLVYVVNTYRSVCACSLCARHSLLPY